MCPFLTPSEVTAYMAFTHT